MQHIGTERLETKRLILRRFAEGDAENCCRNWGAKEEVYTHISEKPKTPNEMQVYLISVIDAYARPDTYYWAIQLKESRQVIGEVFVDDFGNRNSWCEIDYKIGPGFWGQGLATEGVIAVLDFLFHRVGFHRVQAKCAAGNIGSERVMQKAGLQKEGVLRGFFRRGDEKGFDDVVLYAALSDEWR